MWLLELWRLWDSFLHFFTDECAYARAATAQRGSTTAPSPRTTHERYRAGEPRAINPQEWSHALCTLDSKNSQAPRGGMVIPAKTYRAASGVATKGERCGLQPAKNLHAVPPKGTLSAPQRCQSPHSYFHSLCLPSSSRADPRQHSTAAASAQSRAAYPRLLFPHVSTASQDSMPSHHSPAGTHRHLASPAADQHG
jgi:hypothetical protein